MKADNLRAYTKALRRIVVAIDLGAAARRTMPSIEDDYGSPRGAWQYSPPEAFCRLVNDRPIAHLSDVYALGCLLFELFNHGHHFRALQQVNPSYSFFIAAMQSAVEPASNSDGRLVLWKKNIASLSRAVNVVPIDMPGHSVPVGVLGILNEAMKKLTRPNFLDRAKDLSQVRALIWSAIRCIENQAEYHKRCEQAKEKRRKRIEKIAVRERRLREMLARRAGVYAVR